MKTIRLIVAGALLATGAAAVGQPKDATGVCKDGTFHTGKDREAACRANGGLQEWWGTGTPKKAAPDAGKVRKADPREPAAPPSSDKR